MTKNITIQELLRPKRNTFIVYWTDNSDMLHPQLCQNCRNEQEAVTLAQEYMPREYNIYAISQL